MAAKYTLYSDSDVFHREFAGNATLSEIKTTMGIKGRVRIISECGDAKSYKVDKTGFEFSIRRIH